MRAASDQDLLAVSGVSPRHVKALRAHFAREAQLASDDPLGQPDAADGALDDIGEADEAMEGALEASLEVAEDEDARVATASGAAASVPTELSVDGNDVDDSGSAPSN